MRNLRHLSRIWPLAALTLTGGFAAGISGNGFELAGQSLGFFPFMLLISRIYFDPALAAFRRTPHSADRVFLVNLLTGWTVAGWAACLLWARLPSPTVAQEKKAIPWRTSAGLAVSGIGMVLTGISVGVLGASLTESPTGSMGEHVAPLIMLVEVERIVVGRSGYSHVAPPSSWRTRVASMRRDRGETNEFRLREAAARAEEAEEA